MKSASEAAAYLCKWCVATVEFNRIYKIVEPLQQMKDDANKELGEKQDELAKVKKVVADL